ncbi:YutD family protein [Aerococcus kribbianus]|uniref:YutD family protein n=1 Tax=Aerococcus kribbianus TaxID=2999064 RepID=A0A9X3FWR0_9LACT|nr:MULTISPECIES: YutD family protein [unclassified Aerococcus]MCZ0717644.1 YutD family protein [Aerococcus sp. YH-aer221]MCZ0725932.1 YutD family protein [Aerococcus sp. YH-aer222]
MLSRKRQEELKEIHDNLPYPQAQVAKIDQDKLEINGRYFMLRINYKDALDMKALSQRYMALFDQYDYIVGDWSFDQLRLKGFYYEEAQAGKLDQKINHLPDYILEYCSFGCAYFVLEQERSHESMIQRDKNLKLELEELKQEEKSRHKKGNKIKRNRNKNHRHKTKGKNKGPKKDYKIISKDKAKTVSSRPTKQNKGRKPTTFEIR